MTNDQLEPSEFSFPNHEDCLSGCLWMFIILIVAVLAVMFS